MQQYFAMKAEHPDALLLFQVGDFYELFFDDAKIASSFLGIALTKRGTNNGEPIPLCGVPVHALDHYIVKLVKGGFNVAIGDQMEEAVPGKIVQRSITRVLTPGTLTDTKLLDAKSASYLFAFFPMEQYWGLLFGELLTAQLHATVISAGQYRTLEAEMMRFIPDEIVIPDVKEAQPFHTYFKQQGYCTTSVGYPFLDEQTAGPVRGWLSRQFSHDVATKLLNQEAVRCALYTFYAYFKKNQETALDQFKTVHFYKPEDFLILDPATQRNLELVRNVDGSSTNTLFSLMDRAVTAMGSRMVKKWLLRPLVSRQAIEQRLDAVTALMGTPSVVHKLEQLLREIGDLERVVGRIALKRATVHDYLMLKQALGIVPAIKQLLEQQKSALVHTLASRIQDFSDLYQLLEQAINEDSAQPWIIKHGFDQQLDRLRELVDNSHAAIVALERREQQATGIDSLKIRYNQVHGYYLEITKTHVAKIPAHYQRQQTLVGRERFITPELGKLQAEIVAARHEIAAYESAVFDRIKQEVFNHLSALRHGAYALAHSDALLSFAVLAYQEGYVRPTFNDQRIIVIEQGKHPVVAQVLQHRFIPNDTNLSDVQSLWIITGPNMGGKSTYLRQVALICLMAQCGSFVSARSANLSLLDRIFTRIGAGDNVSGGKSTFLIEMEETAAICTQATERSLVILDEVGRGTSTFDGMAIAQAVIEYLYQQIRAKTLFATHYHELTELQNQFPGIVDYHAACTKTDTGIVFLYKILQGTADGSFGIEVAKLAQLPPAVVKRATEIVVSLAHGGHKTRTSSSGVMSQAYALQDPQAALRDKAYKELVFAIRTLDPNHMTPRQALDFVWYLKQKVGIPGNTPGTGDIEV